MINQIRVLNQVKELKLVKVISLDKVPNQVNPVSQVNLDNQTNQETKVNKSLNPVNLVKLTMAAPNLIRVHSPVKETFNPDNQLNQDNPAKVNSLHKLTPVLHLDHLATMPHPEV